MLANDHSNYLLEVSSFQSPNLTRNRTLMDEDIFFSMIMNNLRIEEEARVSGGSMPASFGGVLDMYENFIHSDVYLVQTKQSLFQRLKSTLYPIFSK